MGGVGGGPCDYCVSPSPFDLDFGTFDFGTSDLGLTINNLMTFCILMLLLPNYMMDLVVYLEDKVCDENFGFQVPGRIVGMIALIPFSISPFFVMKKLSKF